MDRILLALVALSIGGCASIQPTANSFELSATGPDSVVIGDDFEVQVSLTNVGNFPVLAQRPTEVAARISVTEKGFPIRGRQIGPGAQWGDEAYQLFRLKPGETWTYSVPFQTSKESMTLLAPNIHSEFDIQPATHQIGATYSSDSRSGQPIRVGTAIHRIEFVLE